jgi:hypothetical protein
VSLPATPARAQSCPAAVRVCGHSAYCAHPNSGAVRSVRACLLSRAYTRKRPGQRPGAPQALSTVKSGSDVPYSGTWARAWLLGAHGARRRIPAATGACQNLCVHLLSCARLFHVHDLRAHSCTWGDKSRAKPTWEQTAAVMPTVAGSRGTRSRRARLRHVALRLCGPFSAHSTCSNQSRAGGPLHAPGPHPPPAFSWHILRAARRCISCVWLSAAPSRIVCRCWPGLFWVTCTGGGKWLDASSSLLGVAVAQKICGIQQKPMAA